MSESHFSLYRLIDGVFDPIVAENADSKKLRTAKRRPLDELRKIENEIGLDVVFVLFLPTDSRRYQENEYEDIQ
jgi:Na+/melibiose symporter-like transporter